MRLIFNSSYPDMEKIYEKIFQRFKVQKCQINHEPRIDEKDKRNPENGKNNIILLILLTYIPYLILFRQSEGLHLRYLKRRKGNY